MFTEQQETHPMSLTTSILRSPVVAALTSPHGVDRYLELVNPMWAAEEVRAQVVSITRETTAGVPVATIELQTTKTWAGHRAGQYVQLGIEIDGARRTTRCFSISSPESRRGDRITITLRANPDGLVSKYLVERAKPGQIVHLSQAAGEFTLPEPMPNHVIFISGGSGITPVMAMTRTLLRRGYGGTITFLHYAQSPDHQIFAKELAELPPNVHRHLVYPEAGVGEYFTAEALRELVPDYETVDTWACGPAGLIDKVKAAYVASDALRVEFFKPPTVATDNVEGDITFERSGASAPNSGASLLEQAEAAGLTPEYGCRMGICFSCVKTKTDGTVRNILTGEESNRPDEEIRICVSQPVGSCSVDL
jgi:stearoyl-CoA 9-desaturase NADPH oxidoreductase